MKPHRKKRLIIALFIICGVSIAAAFALYALRQSINLYYTPSQLTTANIAPNQIIRLGGMVEKGSVQFAKQGIQVSFVLTDYKKQIPVQYNGVLPALFREGQGIVVEGKLNSSGIVIADQVLAKHDENYMPPGINAVQSPERK